ncbi:hypothetical protein K466DRAFT_571210 [Polyporus arcularius HHB13444]|uniref:Uncharacterized protein n=1 Tax=Polyporus arcularius HHB13444 TaxID=1314778 RepID=A0A5C3NWG0_9APHY|nr:hypothetical protein K466DRAFT_571210 [Polyporus arcularius HHB13444]
MSAQVPPPSKLIDTRVVPRRSQRPHMGNANVLPGMQGLHVQAAQALKCRRCTTETDCNPAHYWPALKRRVLSTLDSPPPPVPGESFPDYPHTNVGTAPPPVEEIPIDISSDDEDNDSDNNDEAIAATNARADQLLAIVPTNMSAADLIAHIREAQVVISDLRNQVPAAVVGMIHYETPTDQRRYTSRYARKLQCITLL